MVTIQPANTHARKKALVVVLITTCCGFAVLSAYSYFEAEIYRYIEDNVEDLIEHSYLAGLLGLVMAAPVIAAAGYLYVYGHRATKAQRMPPPGYEVVRDTRVFEGDPARMRGRIVQLLALMLLLCATLVPFVLWYVFHSLTTQ